ncbi:MAG TPA: YceH family protein [Terriglobales bacterium]
MEILNEIEVRVLGALIEKDITTPDYYPLSLNALVNACNQKNNREPVTAYDEESVRGALHSLQEKRLAGPASGADSRVTKYEHRSQEKFNFDRREIAVLCVLLLRGAQTPGELRGRSERMFHFETLDDVQSALQRLMQREPALARVLPRQPGTKESRYMHLLAGDVEGLSLEAGPVAPHRSFSESLASHNSFSHNSLPQSLGRAHEAEKVARLEEEVAALQEEISSLKQQFAEFRKQFE